MNAPVAHSASTALLERLAALEAGFLDLRRRLERLEPEAPHLTPEQAALLVALARRIGHSGEAFLVRHVLKIAVGEPSLAALVDAVAAPGEGQAQALGQAFRAMAGIPAEGLILRRAKAADHRSGYWYIELAPPECPPAAASGWRPGC
jgi:hypothetical protein